MKKIIFILFSFFALNNVFSQESLKEFTVDYELKMESFDEAKKATFAAMDGLEMTMHYGEKQQKLTMDMMYGMMQTSFYMNPKEKSMRAFMSVMGQKIEMTGLDSTYRYALDNPEKVKTEYVEAPKATGKTKKIAGQQCEEYIYKIKKDNTVINSSAFIAKDIQVDKSVWATMSATNSMMPMSPDGSTLKGFPFETTITTEEYKMTISVKNLKKKVNAEEFVMPEGYTKMSQEQLKKMGKKN